MALKKNQKKRLRTYTLMENFPNLSPPGFQWGGNLLSRTFPNQCPPGFWWGSGLSMKTFPNLSPPKQFLARRQP